MSDYSTEKKFNIVCPYCFNDFYLKAEGNLERGKPFTDTDVEYRSENFYTPEDIMRKFGSKKELDIKGDIEGLKRLEQAEKLMLKDDEKYTAFWDKYGTTTETPIDFYKYSEDSRANIPDSQKPWKYPIVKADDTNFFLGEPDKDGFHDSITDGTTHTNRRVCPFCHNPLPDKFGKYPVKNIVVVGTVGCGKTVYISQLLKGFEEYAYKSGVSVIPSNRQVKDFISNNPIEKGVNLPAGTSSRSLSQPMTYSVIYKDKQGKKRTETIVIYDIAGENCEDSNKLSAFSSFILHADAIIFLVEPEQLGLLTTGETKGTKPKTVISTLYNTLLQKKDATDIPIAICISKADACFGILPEASEDVAQSEEDDYGDAKQSFNAGPYNVLSAKIRDLIKNSSKEFMGSLKNNFNNYNFFAVSALGCDVDTSVKGVTSPSENPSPKRIEEPLLWIFKHFGYIDSDEPIKRPYTIKNEQQYVYVEKRFKLFSKDYLTPCNVRDAETEDDMVFKTSMVRFKDGRIEPFENYKNLPIK